MKFLSTLILTIFVLFSFSIHANATKKKKVKKINYEDAKELCLITKGASISDEHLEKCIKMVIKTGHAPSK
jgi:hypothetical protein